MVGLGGVIRWTKAWRTHRRKYNLYHPYNPHHLHQRHPYLPTLDSYHSHPHLIHTKQCINKIIIMLSIFLIMLSLSIFQTLINTWFVILKYSYHHFHHNHSIHVIMIMNHRFIYNLSSIKHIVQFQKTSS